MKNLNKVFTFQRLSIDSLNVKIKELNEQGWMILNFLKFDCNYRVYENDAYVIDCVFLAYKQISIWEDNDEKNKI